MNTTLFYARLLQFYTYIVQTKERKALLLLDNVSSHRKQHSLLELAHVRVVLLPLNMPSKFEPLDAGIRATLKKRY